MPGTMRGGDYGARTPLQLAWLAAALGLVGLLVVGGGWLAWRGASMHPPAATVDSAAAVATVTSGVEGAVVASETVAARVPWAWPLTAEGAAAAAVTAVAVTGQPEVVFDSARFAEVAEVVFSGEQARAHARQVDAARTQFELSGWAEQPEARRMYHFAPLAVRLAGFEVDLPSARVEVWAMTLIGVGDAGGAKFTTSTVDLEPDPQTGTWRVVGLESVEGPTPVVVEPPSAPGRTRALVRDAMATLPLPLAGQP